MDKFITIITDPFMLTILVIVFSSLLTAVIKRVHRDKCLKSFSDDLVTLLMHDGSSITGKLDVESNGIELIYKMDEIRSADELSYILYEKELSLIALMVRFYDDMNDKNKQQRKKAMEKAYHPNVLRKLMRKISNLFKLLKDSMLDIFTQVSSKITSTAQSTAYTSQSDKYVKNMSGELLGTVNTASNPLIEKYIGNMVVTEYTLGDKKLKLCGVLGEYTSKYIKLLDVDIDPTDQDYRRCDVLVPTTTGRVRHIGESVERFNLKDVDFVITDYKKYMKKLNRRKNRKK